MNWLFPNFRLALHVGDAHGLEVDTETENEEVHRSLRSAYFGAQGCSFGPATDPPVEVQGTPIPIDP